MMVKFYLLITQTAQQPTLIQGLHLPPSIGICLNQYVRDLMAVAQLWQFYTAEIYVTKLPSSQELTQASVSELCCYNAAIIFRTSTNQKTFDTGYETARSLALHGSNVVLACRSIEKAEEAIRRIKCEKEGVNCNVLKLDLSSLHSVQEAAEEFRKSYK